MKNEHLYLLVEKIHPKSLKKTKQKLYKKLLRCRSVWSKENNTTPEHIERMFVAYLGKKCCFCEYKIDIQNMSLDHILPLNRLGERKPRNLTIVCKRCNVRKGILTRAEYDRLLTFLNGFDKLAKEYVLRKLSSQNFFKGLTKK